MRIDQVDGAEVIAEFLQLLEDVVHRLVVRVELHLAWKVGKVNYEISCCRSFQLTRAVEQKVIRWRFFDLYQQPIEIGF